MVLNLPAVSLKCQTLLQVLISVSYLLITSLVLSIGVFTVPIETAQPGLRTIWSDAQGLSTLLYAPAMLITGAYLTTAKRKYISSCTRNRAAQHEITYLIQKMALPISSIYLMLILGVFAINNNSAMLLRLSCLPLTIPNGFCYLVVIETLVAWLPGRATLAMSLNSVSFGASQFFLAPILSYCIDKIGVRAALVSTGVIMFVLSFLHMIFLRMPTEQERLLLNSLISTSENSNLNEQGNEIEQGDSRNYGIDDCENKVKTRETIAFKEGKLLPFSSFLMSTSFYFYLVSVFMGRAAYGLIPYYFKLGHVYDLSNETIVISFQILSILATIYAFLCNSLLEKCSRNGNSVVRQFLSGVFVIQVMFFLLLIYVSKNALGNNYFALMYISILIIMLETQTAYSVILAHETFGIVNASSVYGMAGGFSYSVGAAGFIWIMAFFEKKATNIPGFIKVVPSDFIPFYYLACGACLVGAICTMLTRRYSKAFHTL